MRGLLSLAVGVVIVAALAIAKEVFLPITLAILLSFILAPLVSLLRKLHMPHVLAVLISALSAIILFAMLGSVIGSQFAGLAHNIPSYTARIETKVTTLREQTIGRLAFLQNVLPKQIQPHFNQEKPAPAAAPVAPSNPPAQQEANQAAMAVSILLPILSPIENIAIIGIVAIFILIQRNDLRDRIIRLFGTRDLHRTTVAMDEAAQRLSHYFLAQLAVNTGFGVIIGCGLAIIGVPSAILFGTLAGILRFIPYVGVIVAAALPAALAAAVSPEWTMMWWSLALVGGVELITGQIVEPYVYGNTTGLSPLSIVVATIFWAWLWGPIGLVLATPLTLCLVVLGRYVDHLEFLDVLFGDQPALTPIENFYQHMLAYDPDEALHQADLLLKQMSLSSYYDEVAINGLRLAAYDADRGVLPSENVERLNESLMSLIEDLDDYDDVEPDVEKKTTPLIEGPSPEGSVSDRVTHPGVSADQKSAVPILCIPGRGPFDQVVARIFVQLLRKRNIAAELAPQGFAARRSEAAAYPLEPAMVCAIYLEIRNNSRAARALVRRLRQQMPDLPMLLGLWVNDNSDSELIESAPLQGIYRIGSLREGLAECVDLVIAMHERSAKVDIPCPAEQ